MKKSILYAMTIAAAFFFAAGTAYPAIYVVSVKGDAAYAEGKAWRPLAKGMAVREGTRVSTGVNSTAVLNIDDHILTVKPLTMIKVYRNSLTRKTSDNTIGLKYGTVNARIKRVAALKTFGNTWMSPTVFRKMPGLPRT